MTELVRHALDSEMNVEIYTNLLHATPAMWETFRLPDVRIATSHYPDRTDEHEAITKRPSHKVIAKNIVRACESAFHFPWV
ncbi:hypothetical protein ACWEJ6_43320 [Nonomuraea sp. NPDC004702]